MPHSRDSSGRAYTPKGLDADSQMPSHQPFPLFINLERHHLFRFNLCSDFTPQLINGECNEQLLMVGQPHHYIRVYRSLLSSICTRMYLLSHEGNWASEE